MLRSFTTLFFFFSFFVVVFAQKPSQPFSCYHAKKHKKVDGATSIIDLRADTIDISHISIDLDLSDWTAKEIKGFATLSIKSKQNAVSSIALDLLELSVDSVKVNNQLTTNYTYNDTLLRINFASPLFINQTAEVTVYYQGAPIQNSGDWGGFYWDNLYAYNIGVSFLEDPHNYGRVWFPCFDNFVSRSTYDFSITTNSNRKAFCNGLLVNEIDNGNSTKTWQWEMNQKIPSYLASVTVSDYATVEMQYNGIQGAPIPVQLAARAVDTTKLKSSFLNLLEAMSCYESSYLPYAFDRVGYCITSFSAGAMEHATNISYMRAAINGSLDYETLMAHELSHHWWGDLITCREAKDMWLNEGWATYSEALFLEYVYGKEAYKDYARLRHDEVLRLAHIKDNGYYPVSGVPSELTYSTTVYEKGAEMAHTLRGMMGDNLFFSCISSFLNENAFKDVSSRDFETYLTNCSGIDLKSFFDTWIFEKGFHHYSIADYTATSNGNVTHVKGSIKQKLWENTSFTTSLFIEISFFDTTGQHVTKQVHTIGDCTSFEFDLPFNPVYYALDVDEKIQDATIDKMEYVKQTGIKDFGFARVIFDVQNLTDSVLLHATHHYIKPDGFQVS